MENFHSLKQKVFGKLPFLCHNFKLENKLVKGNLGKFLLLGNKIYLILIEKLKLIL